MIEVVYVAYRTPPGILQESIDSIIAAAAHAGAAVSIAIADNGGSDLQRLRGVQRITGSGSNVGFGAAVNEAVRTSTADSMLLMNPDSSVDADFFEHYGPSLDTRGAVFNALLLKDGRPQVHAYSVWWSSIQLALLRRRWERNLDHVVSVGTSARMSRLCGAGLYGDRKVLASLGPFDESFFLYGEDVDFSLRARRAGYALVLVPRAVIRHDAGTSTEAPGGMVERAQTDAHLRLVARYGSLLASFAARGESCLVTILGALATRNREARARRLDRLKELRRWGVRRTAPPFRPEDEPR